MFLVLDRGISAVAVIRWPITGGNPVHSGGASGGNQWFLAVRSYLGPFRSPNPKFWNVQAPWRWG